VIEPEFSTNILWEKRENIAQKIGLICLGDVYTQTPRVKIEGEERQKKSQDTNIYLNRNEEYIMGKNSIYDAILAEWNHTLVVMHTTSTNTQSVLETFLKSKDTIMSLRHPNIIQCLGVATHPRHCFFLMELVETDLHCLVNSR